MRKKVSGLENVHFKMIFLWVSLVCAVYLYTWIAKHIELKPHDSFSPNIAALILIAVGAYSLIVQVIYGRWYFKKGDTRLFPQLTDPEYPPKKNFAAKLAKRLKITNLPLQERGIKIIQQDLITTGTVLWCAAKVFVLFGFGATFFSGDPRWVNKLAIVSFANLLIYVPVKSNFENRLQRWNDHLDKMPIEEGQSR